MTGTESASLRLATSQTWTSPIRAGRPPVTASFLPSGENASDSIRSDSPTSRPTSSEPSAFQSKTSWNPATASSEPSGENARAGITGSRVYSGGWSMSYRALAFCGVSSLAPWAIQRVISSISPADSGGLSWGISALPSLRGDLLDEVALRRLARARSPRSSLSPPLSMRSKAVIT